MLKLAALSFVFAAFAVSIGNGNTSSKAAAPANHHLMRPSRQAVHPARQLTSKRRSLPGSVFSSGAGRLHAPLTPEEQEERRRRYLAYRVSFKSHHDDEDDEGRRSSSGLPDIKDFLDKKGNMDVAKICKSFITEDSDIQTIGDLDEDLSNEDGQTYKYLQMANKYLCGYLHIGKGEKQGKADVQACKDVMDLLRIRLRQQVSKLRDYAGDMSICDMFALGQATQNGDDKKKKKKKKKKKSKKGKKGKKGRRHHHHD